jgi:hypothetical protein
VDWNGITPISGKSPSSRHRGQRQYNTASIPVATLSIVFVTTLPEVVIRYDLTVYGLGYNASYYRNMNTMTPIVL